MGMTNEEAIAFFKDMNECTYGNLEAVEMAIEALEQQPSKGHWIKTGDYYTGAYECLDYFECSCCHEESLEEGDFCPNCGADMRESEERVCMELKLDKKFIDEAVQEAVKDIKQNYISKDVLDKIRAEIIQMDFDFGDFYDHTDTIKEMVVEVIDKYKAESEDKK